MVNGARVSGLRHLAAVVLLVAGCLGCGSSYAVRHTVREGDTVAALARRYGVNEGELRRFNRLDKDDQLRLGDLIFVPGARTDRGKAAPRPAPAVPPGVSAETPVQPPPARVLPAPRPASAPQRAGAELAWPTDGDVLRGFGSGPVGDNRGLDIAADAGAAVYAAGAGTVTYAGAPAAAYGTIVIVEHPDKLFTVYSKLMSASVIQGAQVTRGQELGRVAAGKPSYLHFEVRRDERAEDPLLFLPPR
ncbi:MAG TPA: M23 family metallopeptidase [Deferrisomatales bacterium]|nr:M23 family metallopeptidase [Deferrisomatales bacterium]